MKKIPPPFIRFLGSTLVVVFACAPNASARVQYDSNQLMMKNSEQMGEMVDKLIQKAQSIQKHQKIDLDQGITAEPGAIDALLEALRLILARPDEDGTRGNLFAEVRHELQDLNSFNDAIKKLSQEALETLSQKSISPRDEGSYINILNNLLTELRPETKTNPVIKKIVEDTKNAKIKISQKLKDQAFLRSMSSPTSPSDTAGKILDEDEKAASAKKK